MESSRNAQPPVFFLRKSVVIMAGAIRLPSDVIARLRRNIQEGVTTSGLATELLMRTPMLDVTLQLPGGICPTFEKEIEAGMTFGDVFGDGSEPSVMSKCVEKIRAGAYRLRPSLAKEIGTNSCGRFAQAEWAAFLFINDCSLAGCDTILKWARAAIQEIVPSLGVTFEQAEQMTREDVVRKLVSPPITETTEPRTERSQEAQGQTKKPGSHSQSKHK